MKKTKQYYDDKEMELRNAYKKANLLNIWELTDEIVQLNIPLVKKIASQFKSKNATYDDFVSEGINALYKAVDDFDFNAKNKMVTFFYYRIYEACQRLQCELSDTFRVSPSNVKLGSKIEKFEALNKGVSDEVVMKEFGVSKDRLHAIRNQKLQSVSTSVLIGEDDTELLDMFVSDEDIESRLIRQNTVHKVEELIDEILNEQEKDVILNCVIEKMKMVDYAEINNIPQCVVKSIKTRALKKLRKNGGDALKNALISLL